MSARTITPRATWRTAWVNLSSGEWYIIGIRDGGEDIQTSIIVAADPETATVRTTSGSLYRVNGPWPDVLGLPRIGGTP